MSGMPRTELSMVYVRSVCAAAEDDPFADYSGVLKD